MKPLLTALWPLLMAQRTCSVGKHGHPLLRDRSDSAVRLCVFSGTAQPFYFPCIFLVRDTHKFSRIKFCTFQVNLRRALSVRGNKIFK